MSFYCVAYKQHTSLIIQQITSNYPDAEVREVKEADLPNIKPDGYTLRISSVNKDHDDVYPIKTYKYFEDDPLSTFTNNFWSLGKEDKAVVQFVMKPLGSAWNKKAKEAASAVAKWEYKKWMKLGVIGTLFSWIVAPFSWFAYRFIKNEADPSSGSNAPGASGGDAYKIFNQAEQEAHKMVGESAGQPGFECSIRILVSSQTRESASNGVKNLIAATSIFTDEYNNKLDNSQWWDDIFRFISAPIGYFEYHNCLSNIIWWQSRFSCDELSTMYHFPDINYNKSPVIKWLDYKMLPTPSNLKFPKDPTLLSDYKRDKDGNILSNDGSHLKVDKNKNLFRDSEKQLEMIDGTKIPVYADGDNKGKPIDEWKTPIQETQHRKLAGFPLYKDAVLMGWNVYRNMQTPIYNRKIRVRKVSIYQLYCSTRSLEWWRTLCDWSPWWSGRWCSCVYSERTRKRYDYFWSCRLGKANGVKYAWYYCNWSKSKIDRKR